MKYKKNNDDFDYFYYAENDYQYWIDSFNYIDLDNIDYMPNALCSNAANIVERYLKYILRYISKQLFLEEDQIYKTMRSHNLREIADMIMDLDLSFEFDEFKLRVLSNYYFDVRYPSENSYYIKKKDIMFCKELTEEIRNIAIIVKNRERKESKDD